MNFAQIVVAAPSDAFRAIIVHEMCVTSAVRSIIKTQISLLDVLSFRATKFFSVDEPLSHVMDSGRYLQASWKTVKPLLRPHSEKLGREARATPDLEQLYVVTSIPTISQVYALFSVFDE